MAGCQFLFTVHKDVKGKCTLFPAVLKLTSLRHIYWKKLHLYLVGIENSQQPVAWKKNNMPN